MATWCEELTHLKRPQCWERLKAGEEGDNRGWDDLMASLTQCTWVWVSSGSSWWAVKSGILQSMGLQGVRQDWATELNWTERESCTEFWGFPTFNDWVGKSAKKMEERRKSSMKNVFQVGVIKPREVKKTVTEPVY